MKELFNNQLKVLCYLEQVTSRHGEKKKKKIHSAIRAQINQQLKDLFSLSCSQPTESIYHFSLSNHIKC